MNHDKEVLKVILLGNGGVGKSSLMRRYVNGIFEAKTLHTIGVEFLNKTVEFNKKTFTLQVKHTVIPINTHVQPSNLYLLICLAFTISLNFDLIGHLYT
jgi:GTPase SAR1 family protein